MKLYILLCLCLLILLAGCTSDQSDEMAKLQAEVRSLKEITEPPPSSLDNLYPPKSEAPILLLKMFELATSMAGIGVDSFENDFENAKAHYEKFKAQYVEISKLVPEWEKAYAMEPVAEIGEAVGSGDLEKLMGAFEKLDRVCYGCHMIHSPKVQQKYHWDDYYELSVTDPATNKEVSFKQLKQHMWSSFGGIGIDLAEGQPENALKNYEAFLGRFQALKETCEVCHETKREYYIDDNIMTLIDQLGAVLSSPSPDPKKVGELSREIGAESCLKCHKVHSPTAFTKARWKEWEQIRGMNQR